MTKRYTKKCLYDLAIQFRNAAVADGWEAKPTYENESIDRATSLTRDGFKMQIITRYDPKGKVGFKYVTSVNLWGPDRLAIKPTKEYSWKAIIAGLRTCNHCEASDVETFRYSFAGRACEECLPALKAEHERPGWTK